MAVSTNAYDLNESTSSEQALKALLDPKRIPKHVALIMDGNRRWAKQRGLPQEAGHMEGVIALRRIVSDAAKLGIRTLTVYGFSTENWGRSAGEVSHLIALIGHSLKSYTQEMISKGVRLATIGDIGRFPPQLVEALEEACEATRHGDAIDLVLALNYGGRDDICRAAIQMAKQCLNGSCTPEEITEERLAACMDTAAWSDPDLMIRTSGEYRLSNFLLWQLSYTEVHVVDIMWPDFTGLDLIASIVDYQQRKRRLGE